MIPNSHLFLMTKVLHLIDRIVRKKLDLNFWECAQKIISLAITDAECVIYPKAFDSGSEVLVYLSCLHCFDNMMLYILFLAEIPLIGNLFHKLSLKISGKLSVS